MKDAFWFSHDSNAKDDIRMQYLIYEYGLKGYGMFWLCVEMMSISHLNLLSVDEAIQKISEPEAGEFICDCVDKYGLFIEKDGKITTDFIKFRKKIFSGRLFNINIDLWYELRQKAFERDNFTCQYCGQVGGILEADHVVPFSRGGTDDIDNLKTACRKCNRQKKNKTVEEFQEWRLRRGNI